MQNYAMAQMKKKNAAVLEAKADAERGHKIEFETTKGPGSFPKYDEYEVMPGKKKNSSN